MSSASRAADVEKDKMLGEQREAISKKLLEDELKRRKHKKHKKKGEKGDKKDKKKDKKKKNDKKKKKKKKKSSSSSSNSSSSSSSSEDSSALRKKRKKEAKLREAELQRKKARQHLVMRGLMNPNGTFTEQVTNFESNFRESR
eukprot:TRINITY_DN14729_c0_g1_i1.p1 TRINITY_DN14729_c0_g1~~TRINITY_DN14729_c0_g1_i1.p1  ORF type:complete len:153 (-),score=47.09 TRINITY_DN14729_c0_g1_i1:47-475(-)